MKKFLLGLALLAMATAVAGCDLLNNEEETPETPAEEEVVQPETPAEVPAEVLPETPVTE